MFRFFFGNKVEISKTNRIKKYKKLVEYESVKFLQMLSNMVADTNDYKSICI